MHEVSQGGQSVTGALLKPHSTAAVAASFVFKNYKRHSFFMTTSMTTVTTATSAADAANTASMAMKTTPPPRYLTSGPHRALGEAFDAGAELIPRSSLHLRSASGMFGIPAQKTRLNVARPSAHLPSIFPKSAVVEGFHCSIACLFQWCCR